MAQLSRVTHKIFGLSGAANEFVQFGSTVTGTPVYTQDPATIVSLSAYGSGWQSAIIGGNRAPSMQETNALDFYNSRQIGYLMQSGIAEWDSSTDYYYGCIVRLAGTYQMFGCVAVSNTGTSPSASADNAVWVWINRPVAAIGEVITSGAFFTPTNFLPCDTSWSSRVGYSRTTYANLFNAITLTSAGTFTIGSAVVTGITTTTSGIVAGMPLGGSAFPLGTTVLSVDSSSQITMSANATSAGQIAFIVAPHGIGDNSTTFNVPCVSDFVRAATSSRASGSFQSDSMQGHAHTYVATVGVSPGAVSAGTTFNFIGRFENTTEAVTDGTHGTPRIDSETRPMNTALLYCIRYAV